MVSTSPADPARQIFALFFSKFQNSHLAALRPADIVTPTQIELPQKPTRTAQGIPRTPYLPTKP